MVLKKISMLLFLIGAVTAIMGGAFPSTPETENLRIILLIIFGIFIGIINISQEQEYGFLLASGVFIIAAVTLTDLLAKFLLFDAMGIILENFIIFISPAAVIVAFKVILEFASQSDWSLEKEEESLLQFYSRLSKKERIWDLVILFAVSIAIIVMILQLFYDLGVYTSYVNMATYFIAVIFIIDVVVLFNRAENFKGFMKNSWLDVIAAVPLGSIFQLAKTLRLVRIVKILSRTQKIARGSKVVAKASQAKKLTHLHRLSHLNQPTKFFSKKSGFNKYVKEPKKKK